MEKRVKRNFDVFHLILSLSLVCWCFDTQSEGTKMIYQIILKCWCCTNVLQFHFYFTYYFQFVQISSIFLLYNFFQITDMIEYIFFFWRKLFLFLFVITIKQSNTRHPGWRQLQSNYMIFLLNKAWQLTISCWNIIEMTPLSNFPPS